MRLSKMTAAVTAVAVLVSNLYSMPIVEASGSPPKSFSTIAGGYSTAAYVDTQKIVHFSDGKSIESKINSVVTSKEADGRKNYLAITDSGVIWGYGDNSSGQLGDGTTTKVKEPKLITDNFNAVSVSMGKNFSAAVDSSGGLWCWGDNSNGQLGDGTTENSVIPKRINSDISFKIVSCGSTHSVALDTAGHLYEWGSNASQSKEIATVPTLINSAEEFCYISCGQNHSAAIDVSGNLWVWGANRYGQLGLGNYSDSNSLTKVGTTKFNSVSCGGNYTIAIDTNGNLWGTGLNTSGQLGDSSTVNKTIFTKLTENTTFLEVNAGLGITCARDSAGNILWCGRGIGNSLKAFDNGIGASESYNIVFDSNDGTGNTTVQKVAYDREINLDTYSYTRKGYSFLGWSRSRQGNVDFADGVSVKNLAENNEPWNNFITLYAQWSPNSYTISFDDGSSSIKATFDEFPENVKIPEKTVKVTLDAGEGILNGNSTVDVQLLFNGYYDVDGIQYYDSTGKAVRTWDRDADTVLSAKWDCVTTKFEIPGRSDYTFNGWSEKPNADSGSIVVNVDKDTTLYAVWVEGTDLIIYNYIQNGGSSVSTKQASIPFGASVDLTVAAKKTGWSFVGWNTDPNATVALESLKMPAAGVILYAIYCTDATAFFTDGSGTRKSTKELYNNEKTVSFEPLDIRSFSGWEACGWSDSELANASLITEFKVTAGEKTNFYAIYQKNLIAAFKYGDADSKVIQKTVKGTLNAANIGIKGSVDVKTPTAEDVEDLEGWTLLGWTNSPDSFDVLAQPGLSIGVNKDSEFYAVYERDVTATYNSNGGVGVPAQTGVQLYNMVNYKNPIIEVASTTKEGYHLKSWIVGNKNVTPSTSYEIINNVTLLAEWSSGKYTIKFDGNGASDGSMQDLEMIYDVEERLPNNTYKKEFTVSFEAEGADKNKLKPIVVTSVFEGWEFNGKLYQDSQLVTNLTDKDETIVLKACWRAGSCKLPIAERKGYIFKGWSDGNKTYNGEFVPTKNTKLTAIWDTNSGSVKIQTGISANPIIFIKPVFGNPMPQIEPLTKTCTVTLNYGTLRPSKKTINVPFVLKGIYDQPGGKGTQYYDSNGASVTNWDKMSKNSTLYAYWTCNAVELPVVELTGYEIEGWYDGSTKVKSPYVPAKNVELLLKAKPSVYSLILNTRGGQYEGVYDSYTYGSGVILPIPTKENYVFQGWYDSDGVLIEEISSTDTKDFKLNAKWARIGAPVPKQTGNETLKNYTISSEVEMIPAQCFSGCINLKTVTIEEGLLEICSKAFENCKLLEEIVLPESCLFIGADAFKGCTSLKRIVIKNPACKVVDRLTTIPAEATIEGWSGAWSEQYARNYSRNFISLGNTDRLLIETSGNYTVDYIAAGNHLPLVIDVPASIDGREYFLGYACLDGISGVVENDKTSVYKGIGTLVYDREGNLLLDSYTHSGGSITIKAVWSAEGTVGNEFKIQGIRYQVSSATSAIVVVGTKSLKKVSMVVHDGYSYSVVSIGSSAFKNCKKLKTAVLGSSVCKIKANAFSGASKLNRVTCKGKLKSIGKNAFKGTKKKLKISAKNKKKDLKKLLKNSGNKTIVV